MNDPCQLHCDASDASDEALESLIASLTAPAAVKDTPIETYLDDHEQTDETDSADFVDVSEVPDQGVAASAAEAKAAIEHARSLQPAPLPQLDAPAQEEARRMAIYVTPGKLYEAVQAAERALAESGRFYQRGGTIVAVRQNPDTGDASIVALGASALAQRLSAVATWMKFHQRTNTWVEVDPASRVCNALFKAESYQELPVLHGLARQPHLRGDGSLCATAGYDLPTRIFGTFDASAFTVPDAPTRTQAEQALATLGGLLDEFEFAGPSDRSAALAALLTAAVRPSLPQAPMFHVRAHQVASGKSYLCSIITALATPQRGIPVGFPVRDEECNKLLLAHLAGSPAVIEFDNLTDDIKAHKSLCTVLTSDHIGGRVPGGFRMLKVGTRALFLSSGNNVGPVADMRRRCLTINLDPACEMPGAREFKRPDLLDQVLRDRPLYVSAALTVVRAWVVADSPKTACRALAGFNAWSEWCRQPLLWLGEADPAEGVFTDIADSPERILLGRVLHCWHDRFGAKPTMTRDAIAAAIKRGGPADYFLDALLEFTGDGGAVNPRKLGHAVTRHAGQIVDGLRFSRAPKTRNVESWRVESVVSV